MVSAIIVNKCKCCTAPASLPKETKKTGTGRQPTLWNLIHFSGITTSVKSVNSFSDLVAT